jgi:hypothetical protein
MIKMTGAGAGDSSRAARFPPVTEENGLKGDGNEYPYNGYGYPEYAPVNYGNDPDACYQACWPRASTRPNNAPRCAIRHIKNRDDRRMSLSRRRVQVALTRPSFVFTRSAKPGREMPAFDAGDRPGIDLHRPWWTNMHERLL